MFVLTSKTKMDEDFDFIAKTICMLNLQIAEKLSIVSYIFSYIKDSVNLFGEAVYCDSMCFGL